MWLPYAKAAFRRFGKGKTIMTNATEELNLQELDGVSGGTGSFADVAAYVQGYINALGTVPETHMNLPSPGDFPGCPTAKNGQHG
jgi:hypothetical protein